MAEISDYLKELNEQEIQDEKKIQLLRSSVLDDICDKYELWLENKHWQENYNDDSEKLRKSLKKLSFTARDVTNFSFKLKEYEKRHYFSESGLFLSALIEVSEENKFLIETRHLCEELNAVGFDTTKDIVVLGNLGYRTGTNKQKGTLIIKGNAKGLTGVRASTGAKIIVHGNAGFCTGEKLMGGKISVKGNTDFQTGISMSAGKIIVWGDACGVGTGQSMSGGEIRVYGRIWDLGISHGGAMYEKGRYVCKG